jgi:hypothetical protein
MSTTDSCSAAQAAAWRPASNLMCSFPIRAAVFPRQLTRLCAVTEHWRHRFAAGSAPLLASGRETTIILSSRCCILHTTAGRSRFSGSRQRTSRKTPSGFSCAWWCRPAARHDGISTRGWSHFRTARSSAVQACNRPAVSQTRVSRRAAGANPCVQPCRGIPGCSLDWCRCNHAVGRGTQRQRNTYRLCTAARAGALQLRICAAFGAVQRAEGSQWQDAAAETEGCSPAAHGGSDATAAGGLPSLLSFHSMTVLGFDVPSESMGVQSFLQLVPSRSQGAAPELRVRLEEVDPVGAPWLIIPSSPAASAVLPALTSWDVEPSDTDMQITLDSRMVTLTTPAGNATASCKLQVSTLRKRK